MKTMLLVQLGRADSFGSGQVRCKHSFASLQFDYSSLHEGNKNLSSAFFYK